MLVLTRKPEEQIRIGEDIVITILRVKGNTIRVGVEAPKGVRVIRAELDAKPVESEAGSEQRCSRERLATTESQYELQHHSQRENRLTKVGARGGVERPPQSSSPLGSYVLAARIPLSNPETTLNSRVG